MGGFTSGNQTACDQREPLLYCLYFTIIAYVHYSTEVRIGSETTNEMLTFFYYFLFNMKIFIDMLFYQNNILMTRLIYVQT